jgi:hypothetical protein
MKKLLTLMLFRPCGLTAFGVFCLWVQRRRLSPERPCYGDERWLITSAPSILALATNCHRSEARPESECLLLQAPSLSRPSEAQSASLGMVVGGCNIATQIAGDLHLRRAIGGAIGVAALGALLISSPRLFE